MCDRGQVEIPSSLYTQYADTRWLQHIIHIGHIERKRIDHRALDIYKERRTIMVVDIGKYMELVHAVSGQDGEGQCIYAAISATELQLDAELHAESKEM